MSSLANCVVRASGDLRPHIHRKSEPAGQFSYWHTASETAAKRCCDGDGDDDDDDDDDYDDDDDDNENDRKRQKTTTGVGSASACIRLPRQQCVGVEQPAPVSVSEMFHMRETCLFCFVVLFSQTHALQPRVHSPQ